MNRNSLALCVPPRKPSPCTKMPSLPSSDAPIATWSPRFTRRGSVVTRSFGVRTITQSMRGSRGRRHSPGSLTYVGRLVVEKKPSGKTPSAGAGVNLASGASDSGGAAKFGGRYWKRGRLTGRGKYPEGKRFHKRDRKSVVEGKRRALGG